MVLLVAAVELVACGGGRAVGIDWYEMDSVVATSPELRKKRAGSVGVQEKEAVESLQLGFWLVCSLHLFLLYSGLLLKIFYSGLFVQLPMLWKMEGLPIFMVVAKGRVVGVEEENTCQCSIFGLFVKFSFFVYPPSCLFLLLFINKRGNPLVALYVQ